MFIDGPTLFRCTGFPRVRELMDNKIKASLLVAIACTGIVCITIGAWITIDAQKLRVGIIKADMGHVSTLYARNQFLYQQSGLPFKFFQFNDEIGIIDALARGSIDIAFVGVVPLAIAAQNAGGLDVKIIAGASVNGTCAVVDRRVGISDISGLVNKTIALPAPNTTAEFMLKLAINGTLQQDTITIKYMDVSQMPGSMNVSMLDPSYAGSHVDAFVAWEAIATFGVHKDVYGPLGYNGAYLFSSGDVMPGHTGSVVVVRGEILQDQARKEIVKLFLEIHVQVTNNLANPANAAKTQEIIIKEIGINVVDYIEAIQRVGYDAGLNETKIADLVSKAVSLGMVKILKK